MNAARAWMAPGSPRPRLGLVLAGGLARVYLALGALFRLHEQGWSPAVLTGSSSGALVASVVAVRGVKAAVELALNLSREGIRGWRRFVGLPAIRRFGWSGGRGLISFLPTAAWVREQVGDLGVEEAPIRLGVCVTDAATRRPRFVTRGPLATAVAASCTLPPAHPVDLGDGRPCLDGGLCANVPVALARALGADVVLALDGATDARRLGLPGGTGGWIGRREFERARWPRRAHIPDAPADGWLILGAPDFSWLDLRRGEEMFARGYAAAADCAFLRGLRVAAVPHAA